MRHEHRRLETVNLHRRGGGATIELNRPETLNAWNAQFGARPAAPRSSASPSDDDVRAVLITGAGRGFSSGADLKDGQRRRRPRATRTSSTR